MKKLTKNEMKNVMGGNENVGADGTCTANCPTGSITCSSDKMDCKVERNAAYYIIKVCCDGTCLDC